MLFLSFRSWHRENCAFQASQAERPDDFISDVCGRHGITVDLMDSNSSARLVGRIRILLCLGSLEQFFHELSNEVIALGGSAFFPDQASFDDILQHLTNECTHTQYQGLLKQVLGYFHTVRNEAAHPFDLRQFAGQLVTQAKNINSSPAIGRFSAVYGVSNLPGSSNQMTFDHYILCSRVAKDYAFEVWRMLTPTLNLLPTRWDWKTRFAHLHNRSDRQMAACVSDIRTKLGLDAADATRLYESFGALVQR